MFERTVVGLDIGSYSVKAAVLKGGLRNAEFVRFEETRIPSDASLQEREATVELFLDQHDLSREFVVCSLPSSRVTQRHLRFPFVGSKKVSQAIPFELEEELPFTLDEMVLSHEETLARPGQTDVLVVLAPHEIVSRTLEVYHSMNIEPHILEVEGAVLANVCREISQHPHVLVQRLDPQPLTTRAGAQLLEIVREHGELAIRQWVRHGCIPRNGIARPVFLWFRRTERVERHRRLVSE